VLVNSPAAGLLDRAAANRNVVVVVLLLRRLRLDMAAAAGAADIDDDVVLGNETGAKPWTAIIVVVEVQQAATSSTKRFACDIVLFSIPKPSSCQSRKDGRRPIVNEERDAGLTRYPYGFRRGAVAGSDDVPRSSETKFGLYAKRNGQREGYSSTSSRLVLNELSYASSSLMNDGMKIEYCTGEL
jgi:hypothetical protein